MIKWIKRAWHWVLSIVLGLGAFYLLSRKSKRKLVVEPELHNQASEARERIRDAVKKAFEEVDEEIDSQSSVADRFNQLYGLGSSTDSESP